MVRELLKEHTVLSKPFGYRPGSASLWRCERLRHEDNRHHHPMKTKCRKKALLRSCDSAKLQSDFARPGEAPEGSND